MRHIVMRCDDRVWKEIAVFRAPHIGVVALLLALLAVQAHNAGATHANSTVAAAQGCRTGNPLAGVYHPRRLQVLAPCVAITGVIKVIRHEQDGDYHINVALDAPFRSMLNAGNVTHQHGYLVTEIIPEDAARGIHPPRIGTHVRVVGPWVYDRDHGWNEIHPVWIMQATSRVGSASQTATPAPAPKGGPQSTAFTVRAVVTPNSMPYNAYPTLTAYTSPGASCTASVVYSTGRSPVSFNGYTQTVGGSGSVSWSWHEETKGSGGVGTVACTLGSRNAKAGASFSVTG
jgi:hypothetical protein